MEIGQITAFSGGRPRLRLDPRAVPGAVSLHTRPGDMVLWDNRLWHSAFSRRDRRPRRTLFIGYMPDPGDDPLAIADLRKSVADHLNDEMPRLYTQEMLVDADPARLQMVQRLEELGVENVR